MIPHPESLLMSHCAFASEYVVDQVFIRLLQSARDKLMDFLQNSANLSELSVICGQLFERYVHYRLPLGGNFEIRDLQTGRLDHALQQSRHPRNFMLRSCIGYEHDRSPLIARCLLLISMMPSESQECYVFSL